MFCRVFSLFLKLWKRGSRQCETEDLKNQGWRYVLTWEKSFTRGGRKEMKVPTQAPGSVCKKKEEYLLLSNTGANLEWWGYKDIRKGGWVCWEISDPKWLQFGGGRAGSESWHYLLTEREGRIRIWFFFNSCCQKYIAKGIGAFWLLSPKSFYISIWLQTFKW